MQGRSVAKTVATNRHRIYASTFGVPFTGMERGHGMNLPIRVVAMLTNVSFVSGPDRLTWLYCRKPPGCFHIRVYGLHAYGWHLCAVRVPAMTFRAVPMVEIALAWRMTWFSDRGLLNVSPTQSTEHRTSCRRPECTQEKCSPLEALHIWRSVWFYGLDGFEESRQLFL